MRWLLVSFTKVSAQNYDKTLLTITVYESWDEAYNRILVFQNDKKLEEIPLSKFYYRDLDSHQIAINRVLLKYMNEGFKKVSEIRGTASIVMVTTYTLEK